MIKENGNISIDTENIFPIIKKWLYSDKDIFIREVISNACDAISKFQRLVSLGEANNNGDDIYKVTVSVNKEKKTLKFIDNGIGIPDKDIPYIFERFYRSDLSRDKNTGGSGIGLTITKAFVEAHGGKIYLESKVNEGTTFTLEFPNVL